MVKLKDVDTYDLDKYFLTSYVGLFLLIGLVVAVPLIIIFVV